MPFRSISMSDRSMKITLKYFCAIVNFNSAFYIRHSDQAPLKQEKITIKLSWKNVG